MEIYFDNVLIDEDCYTGLSTNFELFDGSFKLGSTSANTFKLSVDKMAINAQPDEVTIYQNGKLVAKLVVDNIEETDVEYKYTLTDKMINLNFKYDASLIFKNGSATLLQIAQDICSKVGIELATVDFRGHNKKISWYDNTRTAREYIGYIAELNGGYAQIGMDGKLYFLKQNTSSVKTISIEECSDFQIGEKHIITRVVYEQGSLKYEYGDETGNTLYLNDENVFITEASEVEGIYNEIKGFEFYNFKTNNCPIDYNITAGQIITFTDGINNYPTIAEYDLTYNGGWYGGYSLDVATKKQEETQVVGTIEKIRKLSIKVDRTNNTLTELIQETSENTEKLTKHEQTIDEISNKVSHIEETTNTIEGNKTISLGNAIAGELIELHIYGNNDVFSYLTINDDVVLSDDLYLLGDSIIVVKDSKGNSKEYELGITEPLKQKDGVYDEYVLKDGKAKIIRRINEDGTIKAKETIEDLKQFSIELFDGTNTLSIKNYTAGLKAKFAIKNDMTNIYASKVEMNSAIEQSAEKVDISVNKKLESYSKTTEMNALIDVKAEEISSQVKEKVGKAEVGTYIEQNKEAVKLAWNQISEFIQMMIINNNASFAILDNNKKVLMALDKSGQHFYKSDGKTIFGDMGVQKEDNDQYIAFSVLSDYNQKTSNGMAWGIKTKSDNKFHPIFYIKNFEMAEKDSDASYGELVLSFCNILLNGISTGIISGNIKMYGDDANNAIQFINTDTGDILLSISTKCLEGEEEYEKIKILNNISFFRNIGGTNSFKIGNGTNNYVLFEDDGSIGCYGGTVRLGLTGKEVSFDLYVKSLASIYGDLKVSGNVFANNISSDRRIKNNIKACDVNALDIINKFQHKQFDKKDDGKHYNIGYIAQDMEQIDPNFVIKSEADPKKGIEERYYINELPIIATLSKAIQELSQQVEKLQDEIKILKEDKQ